jgi:hypothetical protein
MEVSLTFSVHLRVDNAGYLYDFSFIGEQPFPTSFYI